MQSAGGNAGVMAAALPPPQVWSFWAEPGYVTAP